MSEETSGDLVEVGHYPRRRDAEERGLVLLAMNMDYWIFRRDGRHALCVESLYLNTALNELEKYEAERRQPLTLMQHVGFRGKTSTLSLFVFGWVMAMFFLGQQLMPPWWMDRGAASSGEILHGQWWRAITALTLHADMQHLLANLAAGLLFAAFLVPLFGTGLAWFAIVLSGIFGNLANAWLYRGDMHESIGASTAVFGALGILVAWQVVGLLLAIRRFRAWELIVPVGAGLALLGWLGSGGEGTHTDFMAHFFGFSAGGVLGAFVAAFRLERRVPPVGQRVLAVVALLMPMAAWLAVWKL